MRISDWSSDVCSSDLEVPYKGEGQLEIMLEQDVAGLDQVVVICYGTQQTRDLTGAVGTIDQKTIRDLPVATIDQKMIGQVAGVQIQQVSGAPGAGTSVKIRGSGSLGAGNEPLYVVDGMPYSAGMNQNLNPLRSEERRVGKECVSTCRSRWSPAN